MVLALFMKKCKETSTYISVIDNQLLLKYRALNGILFVNEEGRKHYRISSAIFSDAETELMGQYPAITSSSKITQEIKHISLVITLSNYDTFPN